VSLTPLDHERCQLHSMSMRNSEAAVFLSVVHWLIDLVEHRMFQLLKTIHETVLPKTISPLLIL
jgi:hypothetical protein